MSTPTPPQPSHADRSGPITAEAAEREPLPREKFTDLSRQMFTGPEEEIPKHMAEINDLCEEQELDFFTEIRALGDLIYEEGWLDAPSRSMRPFEIRFLRSMRDTDPEHLQYLRQNLIDVLDNYEDKPQRTLGIYPVPFMNALFMTTENDGELTQAATRLYERSSVLPDTQRYFATQIAVKAGVPQAVEAQIDLARSTHPETKGDAMRLLAKSSSPKARQEVQRQIVEEDWRGEGEHNDAEQTLTNLAIIDPDMAEPIILQQIQQRLDTYDSLKEEYADKSDDYALRQAFDRKTGAWSPGGQEPKTIVNSEIYNALAALGTPKALSKYQELLQNDDIPSKDSSELVSAGLLATISDLETIYTVARQNPNSPGIAPRLGIPLRNAGAAFDNEIWNDFITTTKNEGIYDSFINPRFAELVLFVEPPLPSSTEILDLLTLRPEIGNLFETDPITRKKRYILELAEHIARRPDIFARPAGDQQLIDLALIPLASQSKPPGTNLEYRRLIQELQPHIGLRRVNETLVQHADASDDYSTISALLHTFQSITSDSLELTDEAQDYLEPLLESTQRYPIRELYRLLGEPDTTKDTARYIALSFTERGIIDERLHDHLSEEESAEATLDSIIYLVSKNIYPTQEVVSLNRDEGLSAQDIRDKYELNKRTMSMEARMLDDTAAALEYSCFQPICNYGNVFSFEDFQDFREVYNTRIIDNSKAETIEALKRQGIDINDLDSEKARIYREGIEDEVLTITPDALQELERRTRHVNERVVGFADRVAKIVMLDNLVGRVVGLERAINKGSETELDSREDLIAIFNDHLGSGSTTFRNYNVLYEKLFEVFQQRLTQLQIKKGQTPDAQEIDFEEFQNTEREKFIAEMSRQGDNPEELLKWYRKKMGIAAGHLPTSESSHSLWHNTIRDLQDAFNKMDEIYERIQESDGIEEEPITFRIHFVSKDDPIEFMRIGDARESCIASNGLNNWTVPGYLANEGTGGVIVVDETTGDPIGHAVWHMIEDHTSTGKPVGPIVNGLYVSEEAPSSVGDHVAQFISRWAEQAGLASPVLSENSFGEVVPLGWQQQDIEMRLLQNIKIGDDFYPGDIDHASDLYYDFTPHIEQPGREMVWRAA